MFLGASAFCREWSSSRENHLQRFDKNAKKTRQICHPADTDKRDKNARACPPKLSNHFLDLGKRTLKLFGARGQKRNALTSQSQPLNDIFEKIFFNSFPDLGF